jgi:nucleotide-binding universal stress UspA family protein
MDAMQSILVHIDGSPRSALRLGLAHAIARDHGAAALTALFAVEPRLLPVQTPVGLEADAAAIPVVPQVDPETRRRARAMFDAALASGGVPMIWAEVEGDPPAWGTAQAALYADLLVVGQHDPHDPMAQDVPDDFVESVVLRSGKPVLVVPFAGNFASVGRNVLVAWKPTRECARAVTGAFPLMQRSEHVHAESWGEEIFGPAEITFGIARYLGWHDITATAHRHPDVPDELGQILLSTAADRGCDLMVMGSYGHARIREMLVKGVTRTVLQSMTMPVVMAH